ncbi:uncharacterized protein LOC112491787 [Ziziphus jujuba]|uniref:Uncharacterized protein LOC112491787 n=1 Tax=Ziziphus jujuba TaxID=326968 RepID=A0A6P6G788_ZIZJJ|nr:uncharacterized protein LOC112491787 [Ziziphus jujuba]
MAPYEALYGRKCRSPVHLDDVGERKKLGPEIVQNTSEVIIKIKERMKAAQIRYKSYADNRRKDLEFSTRDMVFLKVAPMKGVMRLALPPALSGMHNVFHVSMLHKYVHDPSHVVSFEPLQINMDLTYEELPLRIVDQKEKELCTKKTPLVKVLWRNHSVEKATRECEDKICKKYLHLFDS